MNGNLRLIAIALLTALNAPGAPKLADERYEIRLFAQSPDIVTPIGAETDAAGRLYVIESHTLTPPEGYPGPKHDRIKVFEDTDRNGKPDKISVFAEDLQSALRLTFGPDGSLYVGCSREIWRLTDSDGDGRAESRQSLVRFETDDPFPWGYIDGLVLSREGDLYFNRGFAGFPHRTIGSDGSTISGYGDGGAVLHCRSDGSKLEFFATGLWASSALAIDAQGRLLMVDNDPLSRGPNRLIHCVEQGDYGFRVVYGLDGASPLIGLSGERAGTLPPVTNTGEGPSDLLICARNPFPENMAESVLVSLWGDNALERHELKSSGLTVRSQSSIWLKGPADFKPVDMVADASGVIYVTDWVKNDFRNHGEGRIWRIAPKPGVKLKPPMDPAPSWKLPVPQSLRAMRAGLRSDDPLVRHAAILRLARPNMLETVQSLSSDPDVRLRLGALVAGRKLKPGGWGELPSRFLEDSEEKVRRAAVVWIGEERLSGLKEPLRRFMQRTDMTVDLLEAALAALAALDSEFIQACQEQVAYPFEKLPHTLPVATTHDLLTHKKGPDSVRTVVLPWLEDPTRPETRKLLKDLVNTADPPLNLAALEVLSLAPQPADMDWLNALVKDRTNDEDVRALAMGLWARQAPAGEVLKFLSDPMKAIRMEAVIGLGQALGSDPSHRDGIRKQLEGIKNQGGKRVRAEVEFALSPEGVERPSDLAEWESRLGSGGNPVAGRRRFFSAELQCITCHRIKGVGGRVGPDLGMIARSQSRADIIRSILRPSEYFGPEFQTWEVERTDGEILSGALLGVKKDGSATLMLPTGEVREVPGTEVKHLRGLSTSLMPSGLEMGMSLESLRDLVAFLAGLN